MLSRHEPFFTQSHESIKNQKSAGTVLADKEYAAGTEDIYAYLLKCNS